MAKFCAECGTALDGDERFCATCGSAVQTATPPAAAPPPAAPPQVAPVPAVPQLVATPAAPPTAPTASGTSARRGGGLSIGQLKWEFVFGILAGAATAFVSPRALAVPAFMTGFAFAFVATLVGHLVVSQIARVAAPLGVLAALLLIFGGAAGAVQYFVAAPDLPGGPAQLLPDLGKILGDLQPVSDAPLQGSRPTFAPSSSPAPDPVAQRATQAAAAIRAAGLPVTAVHILPTEDGKQALVVGLSYERLVSALADPSGLGSGIDALLRVAGVKAVDLSGLGYVTATLVDAQGRPILGVSAPASNVVAFRDGKATRTDLIRALAFKGESRAGLIDAVRTQVAK